MKELTRLPDGTTDFLTLRRQGELYVDKTTLIADWLDHHGKFNFLARPRRFGKSLLVSTLEELFRGHTALFRGTAIHARRPASPFWTWPEPTPVLRFNMNLVELDDAESLKQSIREQILDSFRRAGLAAPDDIRTVPILFSRLLEMLCVRDGPVAVLIDEYDYPILHSLHKSFLPDVQQTLHQFYGVIKERDRQLRFVFITGITRFARTTVFSGLNNLRDLSHESALNALCGFTQAEVDQYLAPYMNEVRDADGDPVEDVPTALRERYNGYRFAPDIPDTERVYNPVSLMQALLTRHLKDHWSDTGVPGFLPGLLLESHCDLQAVRHVPCAKVTRGLYAPFDLARLWTGRMARGTDTAPGLAMLFYQTGYLTLARHPETGACVTDFPNREVASSFVRNFLEALCRPDVMPNALGEGVRQAVWNCRPDDFQVAVNRLLVELTYLEHVPHHRYYQSILHVALLEMAYAADVAAEVVQHQGRADLVVDMGRRAVVMELKMAGSGQGAMAQALDREYQRLYTGRGREVHLWGVAIESQTRQVLQVERCVFPPQAP